DVEILPVGDFLLPDDLAVEVECGERGGTEQNVHALAVGAGCRRVVPAAKVRELPGPDRHDRVPELLAVGEAEARDVLLGELGLGPALGPVGGGGEAP